jgi:RNA polymerase sigma-70 factor, ECF subfamily
VKNIAALPPENARERMSRIGSIGSLAELTDSYRRELLLHCYRILGSVQDAEDLVQETLLAAWRGLERFEGRASLRAWLYCIATNRYSTRFGTPATGLAS